MITSTRHPTRARAAHTLPEVLVVLTILVLLLGILLPRFIAVLVKSRLETAVHALREDIRFARARAISTGKRHQLSIDMQTMAILVEPFRFEQTIPGYIAPLQPPQPPLREMLPTGIRVVGWNIMPLGAESGAVVTAPLATGPNGETPLVFYPEGRSDSAEIVLESTDRNRAGLRVDGFNGEIREMTPQDLRQRS